MDEKSWKTWKSNQNIVMVEELVQNVVMDELIQNGVMDEKFVNNLVMDAKNDPKVVTDLYIFKIGGWNILKPSNRKLSEENIDQNEPWLLIRIPSRDSFLTIQYLERHPASSDQRLKELTPLREGPHVTTQCCMRQHDECCHSESRKESAKMKFMKGQICRWSIQKMRSESSGYMWKTMGAFLHSWRIKIALESYFEKRAQEIWERNWMNPELHTTLLNMYNPILMETIRKALREEDDQMNTAGEIAGSIPETSLECEQNLKGRGGFGWMSTMDIYLKIWC